MELGLKDGAKRVIRIVTIVLAIVCVIWRGKWTWDAYNHYNDEIAACDAAIIKTQTDIQAQRQELADVNTEKNAILANFHELGDAGVKVAQLQTEWSTYSYRRSICQKGEQEEYDQLIYDTERSMLDLFAEVPFGWYAVRQGAATWQCATNYAFYTNTLRTVWLCQQTGLTGITQKVENDIYAYAIADYSYDTHKFTNVEVYVTDVGNAAGVDRTVLEKPYPDGVFPVVTSGGRLQGYVDQVILDSMDDNAVLEGTVPTGIEDAFESGEGWPEDDGTGESDGIPDVGIDAEFDPDAGQDGPSEDDTESSAGNTGGVLFD